MTLFTIKLTKGEVELLAGLASDQLFRREFIDPKMPGHKPNQADLSLGKSLVSRLQTLADPRRAVRQAQTKLVRT